jgi:hypothetical protein
LKEVVVKRDVNPSPSEFEELLRQHIRRRVVPSSLSPAACQEIDLDLAAAYLERSLSGGTRERFEGHLADCVLCRRQLTAMSRMGEAMAPTEATVQVMGQKGYWGLVDQWVRHQWQEAIDRLQVALEWGLVSGQGGRLLVTASLLLLVVGGVGWQLMQSGLSPRQLSRSELPPGPPFQAATEAGGVEEVARALRPEERPRVAPSVGSSLAESASLLSRSDSERPRPSRSTASSADRNTQTLPAPSAPSTEVLPTGERPPVAPPTPRIAGREGDGSWADLAASRSSDVTTRITPLPQDNPMRTVAADEPLRSDRPSQVSNRIEPSRRISGFIPPGRALSNGSLSSGRPVSTPTRRVLDKTFHLSGGGWVDELYLGNLRVRGTVRLKAGTEEYEAVLREHPTLAEYFQLRPVTVVWQGIVYRVVE